MYTKVLVPLDGSSTAEVVLPYARFFAEALHLPVELLYAIDPDIVAIRSDPRYIPSGQSFEANLKDKNLIYLKKLEGLFSEPSKVTCSVELGKPEEVIVERARVHPGTLIAMATHGHGARRWLLGSVAEKVLHTASNHLLLVKGTTEKQAIEICLKTVIVPLDGSSLAEEVLPHISEMARQMDLGIVLLRAYALPMTYFTAPDYYTPVDRVLETVREESVRYLDGKAEELRGQGLRRVSSISLEGEGAEQIIELAQKTPHAFIAMCTHGRSGIGRLLLGSVTSRVVRHSGSPILIIRPSNGALTAATSGYTR